MINNNTFGLTPIKTNVIKFKHILFGIIATVSILMIGPYLTEKVFAFTLTVDLTNKPFGDPSVWVQIQGPNGFVDKKYYNWESIRTGTNAGQVTWNLPDSSFPVGENYKVCVSSKYALSISNPYCGSFVHQGSDESVSMLLN